MVKATLGAARASVQWARRNTAAARGALAPAPTPPRIALSGASKRGWTAWLAAGVAAAANGGGSGSGSAPDVQVHGVAPIVMDMLNITHNLRHVYRAYGGWSFAMRDYVEQNLTAALATDPAAAEAMWSLIDPLTYAANLTMPKLVVDATGDEFFNLDDDALWWAPAGAGSGPGAVELRGEASGAARERSGQQRRRRAHR